MLRSALMLALASTCCARRVQSIGEENGPRDWEIENTLLHVTQDINDAELGMANLKHALRDPSLLADVARGLRHPEGRAELVKMLANPNFQQQMEALIAANGAPLDFLSLEFYAGEEKVEHSNRPDALTNLLLALNPASPRAASASRNVRMAALDDLKEQAMNLNPVVGYFDPLSLSEGEFWGQSNDATVGWLRHSEIKHGRVAMAGFVGYCLHENGIRWPLPLSTQLPDYSSFEGLSAPAVWDAVPWKGRLQIIAVIGFFEIWSESSYILEKDGTSHYMRGGKPGYFPTFKELPHPVPFNLFDPFGFQKGLSAEAKAKKLNAEINNGRLAMLGLISLLSEARTPGCVPALAGVVKHYDGRVMVPFQDNEILFKCANRMAEIQRNLQIGGPHPGMSERPMIGRFAGARGLGKWSGSRVEEVLKVCDPELGRYPWIECFNTNFPIS